MTIQTKFNDSPISTQTVLNFIVGQGFVGMERRMSMKALKWSQRIQPIKQTRGHVQSMDSL